MGRIPVLFEPSSSEADLAHCDDPCIRIKRRLPFHVDRSLCSLSGADAKTKAATASERTS